MLGLVNKMFDYEQLMPGVHRYHNVLQGIDIVTEIEEYAKTLNKTWDRPPNKDRHNFWQISFAATDKVVDETAVNLNELIKPITDRVYDYCNDYRATFSPDGSTHWQCLKYEEGNTFKRHHDDHGSFKSRVSLVYYVNDNYEGGELEFHNFDKVVTPISDTLLIFPSSYLFSHTSLPIKFGTKYAITRFLS